MPGGQISIALRVSANAATAHEQTAGVAPAPVSQLEAAVRRDPKSPSAHIALGLAYWGRNEYPRALQAFRRAVEVGPRSAEAHNWLGVALSEKSDLPGAVAEFRRAIELDPKYGRAYTNLGSALATSGDYAEAVEVFQKALLLEPNNQGAHFNLGMALRTTLPFGWELAWRKEGESCCGWLAGVVVLEAYEGVLARGWAQNWLYTQRWLVVLGLIGALALSLHLRKRLNPV